MEVLTTILDKSLFVMFFMSCLVILRQIFLFIRHLNNPEPQIYSISQKALIYLGVAVAIILTSVIKGIGL